LENIIQVSSGSQFVHGFGLGLLGNGRVLSWGDNIHGQLGDGTTTDRNTPAQVSGLTGAVSAALYNSMYKDMGIVSIALKDVKSVRDGKFGLLAKAIIIEASGNEMVKFAVSKRNEWMEAIKKAVNNSR
jgi:hypothetical protein